MSNTPETHLVNIPERGGLIRVTSEQLSKLCSHPKIVMNRNKALFDRIGTSLTFFVTEDYGPTMSYIDEVLASDNPPLFTPETKKKIIAARRFARQNLAKGYMVSQNLDDF
ncbi:hypothetical protein [Neorhizobium galegae]|uniref:Uncharacterized protein n=1 Tax=Neorhizobium galegae bv. orientalis str. HAMBI 540 TaxID=1028800 RepID=A0A068SKZ6_NEOGA|nr:hypothetical protein [Neorhizobium galegae]CDN46843.1 Hypothetical protein RG540_CH06530 [Neorhizobium galegae bv. orientalis str. HAMBI 540]